MDNVNCRLFYIHQHDSLYQDFPQTKMTSFFFPKKTARSAAGKLSWYDNCQQSTSLPPVMSLKRPSKGYPSISCAITGFSEGFHGEGFLHVDTQLLFLLSEYCCLLRRELE